MKNESTLTIEEIKYIENIRLYRVDLGDNDFIIDYSSPHTLIIDNIRIQENSWGKLLQRLASYVINRNQIEIQTLLEYNINWSKSPIFLLDKTQPSHLELTNGVYLNSNRTTLHLYKTLLEIIKLNSKSIFHEFYIKVPHSKENPSVRDFFIEKSKQDFSDFLRVKKKLPSTSIDSIFKTLTKIDTFGKKFSDMFSSILLFENRLEYAAFKSRFKRYCESNLSDLKTLEVINRILDLYTEYLTNKK